MRRNNRTKAEKDELFFKLTALQLLAVILVFLLLFLLVKRSDAWADRIQNEFSELFSQDWDVAGWFRDEARSVVSAQRSDDGLYIPAFGEEATQADGGSSGAVILTSASAVTDKPAASCLTESFYGEDAPVMPVNGVVTSGYGDRIHPITGEESFHSGRDIAADEGDDIFAVFDGTVVAVGVGERSGNYIKIDHGYGLVALYCHCSRIFAREGDAVRKGDIIAAVGETGAATGPHLHFEVRLNGELTDPSVVLDRAIRAR